LNLDLINLLTDRLLDGRDQVSERRDTLDVDNPPVCQPNLLVDAGSRAQEVVAVEGIATSVS
jgi:hypothetical protein